MYLKSIEVQGFKSFANKIVFEFHQGITGIVGPNGSGKSNVADAVRWVLGEQSVKQLRGSSMQDVIFAGTENRKPLSYAYVAITLDNSDHKLAIDYEEVTVARRLYRSGESEYLLNGSPCRLKEVSELFYDTGIGKEGYSIIGQGQIDRILSGKPEERRELFDEAAGIVKFKKRKATAQKKLDSERDNLVRINDILAELERQVEPLREQSQKARTFLKKKDELKTYDVNMFLLETEHIARQQKETDEKYAVCDAELKESTQAREKIRQEYKSLEEKMQQTDERIEQIRESISNTSVTREKLESQIGILNEQIHTAQMTDEHVKSRLDAINEESRQRQAQKEAYEAQKAELDEQLAGVEKRQSDAQAALSDVQERMTAASTGIENGQKELIELLNGRAGIQSRRQRSDTMLEQLNIRKAQLGKRLLDRKTQESDLNAALLESQKELDAVNETIRQLSAQEEALEKTAKEWGEKARENRRLLDEKQTEYNRENSRMESLKNIAERYDGYGNSIRRVMEQKSTQKGILGVVSDLIQVEKKYETAIETALGGNIQNIVTEDEATAKEMIAFLKKNRYGRATFLPLTSVSARSNPKNEAALSEPGVLGLANRLVKCEPKYDGVAAYLLGRVLVADTIDHAVALARKYHYSLHIVTLEGEYLSPGGSMTGGAFKNSTNLLARRREVDELEKKVAGLKREIDELKERREDIRTAQELNAEEADGIREKLQQERIRQNTAGLTVERAKQQRDESDSVFQGLMQEKQQMERQMADIDADKQRIAEELKQAEVRESELQQETKHLQEQLELLGKEKDDADAVISGIVLEEANLQKSVEFAQENILRVRTELEKYDEEKRQLLENADRSREDIQKKQQDIEEIKKTIAASADSGEKLAQQLAEGLAEKERMSADYRGFFEKQEEISSRCAELDKEIYRLNSLREKLKDAGEYQTNYLWEEYELTPHAAAELKDEAYQDLQALKKLVSAVRDEIRRLGNVNVNAIEEYREVSERYTFLKGQHDDLVEAEQTLVGVIADLDEGMRKQFTEKFAEIQKEFDKAFQNLFGGGRGTLELVEDEDLLECGIRIIAQPPGKKLQNMMQMSGGEKALTAISLLFAIQALKPSPFCLLDEIEAALDDSNVTRFAGYLGKLTKDTQFIVITHRRGTMTAADRLYGITMQEKGVSTLVSVNLIENDLTE